MSRARDVADGALGLIAGTNGQVLTSNGTVWSSQAVPTELPAHGADGNILTSTGSAWASEANPLPAHGTSGNVLTSTGSAWASQAAAGGGAWDLISTTVATGTGSMLTFADQFSTTYDTYQVVGTAMRPASGGIGYLYMRLRSGSGSTTAHSNDYAYVSNYTNTSSGGNYRGHQANSNTYMNLCPEGQTSDQYYTHSFILDIFDPHRNLGVMHLNMQVQGMVTRSSGMNVAFADTRARWNGGASVNMTGFDMFFSGGANIEGRVSVYGQKKS